MPLGRGTIGYAVTPDLRRPEVITEHSALAAKAGFKAVWASDHFHPWHHTGALEYNTWVWMSAAMERIPEIPFGTAVTAPILRYHPGIVAQSFATMEMMFGERVILGVGAGEAMNEVPLGFEWPSIKERRERIVEAVQIMHRLFQEDFVDFNGKYYNLKGANLYMRSKVPIYISGFGPKMARVAGELGDGFVTVLQPIDFVKNVLFPAVDEGLKKSGRDPETYRKVIEYDVSYADDYDAAVKPLRFWTATTLPELFKEPIADPREIERMGDKVTDEQLLKAYDVGTTPEVFIKGIEKALDSGFDHVYLSSTSPDEAKFIEMCGKSILPYFHSRVH